MISPKHNGGADRDAGHLIVVSLGITAPLDTTQAAQDSVDNKDRTCVGCATDGEGRKVGREALAGAAFVDQPRNPAVRGGARGFRGIPDGRDE